jgi:hypothetical protein
MRSDGSNPARIRQQFCCSIIKRENQSIMKSVDNLSDEAKMAYQAFIDMSNSKTAHFSCLEAHTAIYESSGMPSLAEKLEIEKLLADHDKNVLAFKTAMAAVTDSEEKLAVIQLMS